MRSCDSRDRNSASSVFNSVSPVLGGSLNRHSGSDAKRFGRGERRELSAIYSEDGDAENSEARERSNTASGDNSSGRVCGSKNLNSHCTSVPLLVENTLARARLEANVKKQNLLQNGIVKHSSSSEAVASLPYLEIPQYTNPKYTTYVKSLSEDLQVKFNDCISSMDNIFDSEKTKDDGNISSNDDSAITSECFTGVTESKAANKITSPSRSLADEINLIATSNLLLPRIVEPNDAMAASKVSNSSPSLCSRPSYKRSLGSPVVVQRKPSKRDSGVDADDVS